MDERAGEPCAVDLVALFIETAESARPPTPAVVLEHPDRLRVIANADAVHALLHALVQAAMKDASERAEIRLEIGSRPGCTFFLRDNGAGLSRDGCTHYQRAVGLIPALGGHLQRDADPGWGSTVAVVLPQAPWIAQPS